MRDVKKPVTGCRLTSRGSGYKGDLMKIGFLYAGQGSQYVGMGKSLYDNFYDAKRSLDDVSIDFNLKELMFHGPEQRLSMTSFTQPCMVAVAVAATRVLAGMGVVPDIAAGLSLGEYSALYAAGVFDAQTAISLTRFRGKIMEEAVEGVAGKMAAVIGLDRQKLGAACDIGGSLGVVQIANYNCPGQLVIGGCSGAVDLAAKEALSMGAKRVVPLNVGGPFHTKLMEPAAQKLAEHLKNVTFNQPRIPVVFNSTADILRPGQTVAELLTRQMMSPVYFEDSIRYMEKQGVTTIVEIGPGRVLSGFVRKTSGSIRVMTVEDADTAIAAANAINEQGEF